MIINIVEANTKINNLIAQHIIDTSNAEYKEMIKMVNQSVDNNKQGISLRMLVMMKFMLNLNVEKQINLLNNPT